MKKVPLHLRIPPEWIPLLDELAAKYGHSRSAYVRWLLELELKKLLDKAPEKIDKDAA